MEITQQNLLATVCVWCMGPGAHRCSRCRSVYYCSRQHQIKHWPHHKLLCKEPSTTVRTQHQQPPQQQANPVQSYGASMFPSYSDFNQYVQPEAADTIANPSISHQQNPIEFQLPSDEEIFSTLGSELLSSDNNFWDIINSVDAQSLLESAADANRDEAIAKISANLQEGAPDVTANPALEANQNLMQGASLQDICSNIAHDLASYGICVLDNFIGMQAGNSVLQEVQNLYCKGIFKKGELVNSDPLMSKESVRCDVTTWVDGTELGCACIGNLIKKLDLVVTTCNKMQNNGHLSQYKLHRRTKAMIACYPGDGTYYKKHIDNPHKDGRCITCIYYLNKNWNTTTQGGMLRMFPSAQESQVANIEPIFDRMIFFWSDKRNPHEVLPAYATRFAITVWYFDADERDRAIVMFRDRARNTQGRQFRK